MNPMVMTAVGALLLLVGAVIGYMMAGSRGSEKANEVQAELDDYRKQVTQHFSETAQHFQAIGAEYRKLYEHMAAGAGQLCDGAEAVSFEPVEKLTEGVVIDDNDTPRDYEIAEPEGGEQELPDIVETGVTDTAPESGLAAETAEDRSAVEEQPAAEASPGDEVVTSVETDDEPPATDLSAFEAPATGTVAEQAASDLAQAAEEQRVPESLAEAAADAEEAVAKAEDTVSAVTDDIEKKLNDAPDGPGAASAAAEDILADRELKLSDSSTDKTLH